MLNDRTTNCIQILYTSVVAKQTFNKMFLQFIAVTFQVCIQNRYKLTKKYRKLTDASLGDPDNLEVKAALAQAKVCNHLIIPYMKK